MNDPQLLTQGLAEAGLTSYARSHMTPEIAYQAVRLFTEQGKPSTFTKDRVDAWIDQAKLNAQEYLASKASTSDVV